MPTGYGKSRGEFMILLVKPTAKLPPLKLAKPKSKFVTQNHPQPQFWVCSRHVALSISQLSRKSLRMRQSTRLMRIYN